MYNFVSTLALLSVASAQITTSLLVFGFANPSNQTIAASVVGSDSTATTYALACGSSSTDSRSCILPTGFTFTQGPSTIHFDYAVTDFGFFKVTVDLGCQVTTDHETCSANVSIVSRDSSYNSTTATTFTSYRAAHAGPLVVTIAAGAAASSANTIASTTASTTKESSATNGASESAASQTSDTANASSTPASGSKTTTTVTAASSSATSSSSTGGMAMVTGNPRLAVGGAAAALALAVM